MKIHVYANREIIYVPVVVSSTNLYGACFCTHHTLNDSNVLPDLMELMVRVMVPKGQVEITETRESVLCQWGS